MTGQELPATGTEEWWRGVLTDPKYHLARFRRVFLRMPSAPHCKFCGVPFKGFGGAVMGPFGFRPWEKNPTLCKSCVNYMNRYPGGAEVPCTLMFADVRGSTGLAERSSPAEFASLLRRFYAVGSEAVINQGGIVDKYVGDEVVGLFIPGIAGAGHALGAIRAADQLLRATGHGSANGPWLSIGIGVHSGQAFVGTVAVGSEVSDFTALGDTVNVAARIAAEAGSGELLISEDAASTAGVRLDTLEGRELTVRGREAHLAVRVARVGSLAAEVAS